MQKDFGAKMNKKLVKSGAKIKQKLVKSGAKIKLFGTQRNRNHSILEYC